VKCRNHRGTEAQRATEQNLWKDRLEGEGTFEIAECRHRGGATKAEGREEMQLFLEIDWSVKGLAKG
jgi:hypothetical protein